MPGTPRLHCLTTRALPSLRPYQRITLCGSGKLTTAKVVCRQSAAILQALKKAGAWHQQMSQISSKATPASMITTEVTSDEKLSCFD